MVTQIMQEPVMRQRSPNQERDRSTDLTVKIGPQVYRKAKLVAEHRGVPLSDFLTTILDGPVDAAYKAMAADIQNEIAQDHPEPRSRKKDA